MSLHRVDAKRDHAEKAILEALAKIGALVVQMDWLDLLVGWGQRWTVLEVKTGNAKLKPHQEARLEQCHRLGLPATVVRTPEEALQAIGAVH